MGICREFVIPFWPRILAKIVVCETSNAIPAAIARPMVAAEYNSPRRYPMLPFMNDYNGPLMTPQTILRGVTGGEAATAEAARQARLKLDLTGG
jgi:hypothetical protein